MLQIKIPAKNVVCFTFACVCSSIEHIIPHLNAAAAAVTSIVVVVASMTVVTAYLLSQQTAALGYNEVLANPSTLSAHPNPRSLLGQSLSRVTHFTVGRRDLLVG